MIPFQSRLEKQYAVYILDSADVYSEVKVLTGSAKPFTTQEDAKDDIFTPIRKQSGYLRIIDDENGNLLEEIMPKNNTEKMVLLVERDMVDGEYQDGAIAWKGFLCAEAFTQPWNNNINEIEFPVKSVLAALEDVQVNTAFSGSILRLARTIAEGIIALCADMPFESVTHIGSIVASEWMMKKINHKIFFHDETFQSGGDVITTQQGDSYYKAIGEIMKTIGLTARQDGNRLYFARYDGGGYDLYVNTMSWNEFYQIATEQISTVSQGINIQKADLLKSMSFRSNRNEVTFNPGGRIAKVVLNITTMPGTISGLQLPETTENDSEVSDVKIQSKENNYSLMPHVKKLADTYVQIHPTRAGQEVFTFNRYRRDAVNVEIKKPWEWVWNYVLLSGSDFAACVDNSPMRKTYFNDLGLNAGSTGELIQVSNYEIVTGAFPVRWCYREYGSLDPVTLDSGLFVMQKVLRYNDTFTPGNDECYSLSTPASQSLQGGTYFNINMVCHCFVGFASQYELTQHSTPYFYSLPCFNDFEYQYSWGTDQRSVTEDIEYEMACALYAAGQWWNGSGWQSEGTTFYIKFKNEQIVSNKADVGADVEGDGGWFIPIPSDMEGTVIFKIMSWCHTNSVTRWDGIGASYNNIYIYPYAKIIEGLSVGVTYKKEVTESERDTNTYRRVIMQRGFSDDKEIDLTIGTDNNNYDSTPSFLMNDAGNANISTLAYYSEGRTVNERPEEHLLGRVANYYNQVRRAFRAIVESGNDIFKIKYQYNGRWFFGVDKKHNWRDDEQEIRFIEVI